MKDATHNEKSRLQIHGGAGAPAAAATLGTPTGYEFELATRLERAAALGNLVFEAASASVDFVRGARARWRKRQRARINYEAMVRLDPRTLRDIGLERNELAPIALELKREAAYTSARGSVASQNLPR